MQDLSAGVEVKGLVLEGRVSQGSNRNYALEAENKRKRPKSPDATAHKWWRSSDDSRCCVSCHEAAAACRLLIIFFQAASDRGSDANDQLCACAGVGLDAGPPWW